VTTSPATRGRGGPKRATALPNYTRDRTDEAKLRALAGEKGYAVERAFRRNHWHLKNAAGEPITDPRTNSTAFSIDAATEYLRGGKPRRQRLKV
jgi:hypothetical protein